MIFTEKKQTNLKISSKILSVRVALNAFQLFLLWISSTWYNELKAFLWRIFNEWNLSYTILHYWKKFSTHMNYLKTQWITAYGIVSREIHFNKVEPWIKTIITVIFQWVDFNHYSPFDVKWIDVVLSISKIQRLFLFTTIRTTESIFAAISKKSQQVYSGPIQRQLAEIFPCN